MTIKTKEQVKIIAEVLERNGEDEVNFIIDNYYLQEMKRIKNEQLQER